MQTRTVPIAAHASEHGGRASQLRPSSSMSVAEKRIRDMTRPSPMLLVVLMIAGALAGAITGTMAGALGAVIGGALGGIMGAATGVTARFIEGIRRSRDARLDRAIGVDGGDLGRGRSPAPIAPRQPSARPENQLFRTRG